MSMHIAQVRVYAHGQLFEPGEAVFFDGTPTWQYEPTEPEARAEWLAKTADADKVRAARFEANGRWGDPWQFQPDWAPPRPEANPTATMRWMEQVIQKRAAERDRATR